MRKFGLGQVVVTDGATEALRVARQSADTLLRLHVAGQWGEVDEATRQRNEAALLEGGEILSRHTTLRGEPLLILTDADHSCTTLLLPAEY